jgi:hypothetical protein
MILSLNLPTESLRFFLGTATDFKQTAGLCFVAAVFANAVSGGVIRKLVVNPRVLTHATTLLQIFLFFEQNKKQGKALPQIETAGLSPVFS